MVRLAGALRATPYILLALVPSALMAQTIRGHLQTTDAGRGPAGAIVLVMNGSHEVARTLTKSDGGFTVVAPGPGSYGVRVLRMGFSPEDFGPYKADHDLALDLPLSERPISLLAIQVSARSECRALEEGGSATLALWEEARKGLLTTVLTRSTLLPVVTLVNYERVVDPRTNRQIGQHVERQVTAGSRPYVSPLSAEEYARRGYVETDQTGVLYRAPDADILMSESFLARHCLRVVTSPKDTSLIGLAFRPTRAEDGRVDVEGVLWLDRFSDELHSLDVSYVGLSDAAQASGAGASLAFARLPTGGLIVSRWKLLAPRIVTVRGFRPTLGSSSGASLSSRAYSKDSIADLRSIGGIVMKVSVEGATVWLGPSAAIEGQVRESGTAHPIAGVRLQVLNTNYIATTDSSGAFALSDLLAGDYELEARSPQLEATGLDVPTVVHVALPSAVTARVTVHMMPLRLAVARACAMSDTLAALQGTVRGPAQATVSGARVLVRWLGNGRIAEGGPLRAQNEFVSTLTDHDGRYRVCGLPSGHTLTVLASGDNLRARAQVTRLDPDSSLSTLDLTMVPSTNRATADGLARLSGTVRDSLGHAIADVDVDVIGGPSFRTDAEGHYHLDGLVSGTYLLRTRHVGWTSAIERRDVESGDEIARDIVMRSVQLLPGVEATAARVVGTGLAGFEHRRAGGIGSFLDEATITKRGARTTEALLEGIPGIVMDRRGSTAILNVNRGATSLIGQPCIGVAVFVDGTVVGEGFDVNEIPPTAIRAVEFYSGVGSTPPELRSLRTVCGTLAIWLK